MNVHLMGDSLVRGYGAGTFSDRLPSSDWRHPIRSIWATANAAFDENGVPCRFSYLDYNAVGFCDDPGMPPRLAATVRRKIIKDGDWIVLEDAGPHGTAFEYDAMWQSIVDAVRTENTNINILMMTMFDYPPAPLDSQYDAPDVNGITINQVTQTVAARNGCAMLDMNASMDAYKEAAWAEHNLRVVFNDGIHPNLWGQTWMTGRLVAATGFGRWLRSVDGLWEMIRPHWNALGYGAEGWTETRAKTNFQAALQST